MSDLLLSQATVQDIQMELIRRCHPYVADDLAAYPERWIAALIDRPGGEGFDGFGSLTKLRDLPLNYWNVDLLAVLVRDEESAEFFVKRAREAWSADETRIFSLEQTEDALGGLSRVIPNARSTTDVFQDGSQRIVRVWWD